MDATSLLTTLAQLGIALAGFSGIVVALGARARGEWSQRDRGLLRVLLERSGAVVLWSLLPVLLLAAELTDSRVWLLSSASWAIAQGTFLVRGNRFLGETPNAHPGRRFLIFASVGTSSVLALQIANLFWLRIAWPHLAAVMWHLAFAFIVFVRLLEQEDVQ